MKRRRKNQQTIIEPSEKIMSDSEVLHSFNWYRTNYNEKDARQFLLDFIQDQERRKAIDSQSYIPFSYCWTARLISNGNTLPESVVKRLESYIHTTKHRKRKVSVSLIPTVSAEQKSARIVSSAYCFLEEKVSTLYDKKGKEEISAESVLSIYNLNRSQAAELAEELEKNHIRDLREIAKDEDLKEAYSFLTKRQQNLIFNNLKKVKQELLSVKNVASETNKKKKVRKIRIKPIEEVIAKLKFKPVVFENVSQINMKHLLEKKVLYLASEEKRTLLRLEAPAGFEVRNAFLTNVQSIQKIVLYGRNLEKAARLLQGAKKEKDVKKTLAGRVTVRRYEDVELKNNEYRSTDKFTIVQGFTDL